MSFQETITSHFKQSSGSFLVILATAMLLVAMGFVLQALSPANIPVPQSELASVLLHNSFPDPVQKPGDRFMFLGMILGLPVVLMGVMVAARRMRGAISTVPLVLGIVLLTVIAIFLREEPTPSMAKWLVAVGVLLPTIWYAAKRITCSNLDIDPIIVPVSLVASFVLIAALRLWDVGSIDYSGTFIAHYEAVTFAIVHILGGATCLADARPQYGCYGEFIAPILHVTGASVLAITSVYIILQCIGVRAVIRFARSIIHDPFLLIASVACIFIEAVFFMRAWSNDPIFQYYPLRFLFPALSLGVYAWLQQSTSLRRVIGAGVFSGAAIAWNLESGVAVTITLAIFSAIGPLGQPIWSSGRNLLQGACRGIWFVVGVGIFIALFVAYIGIKSDWQIDLTHYIAYQTTFYLTGFGMIPMPPFPDYWTIHAAILVSPLLLLALTLGSKASVDAAMERAAFLAVLGVGLTLYYSGRSHPMVLKLVAWPDAILFFYLCDRMLREHLWSKRSAMVFKSAMIVMPAAFIALHAITIAAIMMPNNHSVPTAVEQDIAFINANTDPGESIGIFALNQSVLYGETRTKPALVGPGIAEMITQEHLKTIEVDILRNGPQKLFIGTGLEHSETGTGIEIPLNIKKIELHYERIATGPEGRLHYYRRYRAAGDDRN